MFCVAYTSDGNTILTASQGNNISCSEDRNFISDSLIRMYRVSGHGKTKNYILKKLLQTPYIGILYFDFKFEFYPMEKRLEHSRFCVRLRYYFLLEPLRIELLESHRMVI